MAIPTEVNSIPAIMMRKYATASSKISSSAPANAISGSATIMATVQSTTPRISAMATACARHSFAPSRSPCPFRRLTMAVMPIFMAKKTAKNRSRGWFVTPTAAMAAVPTVDTISPSTKETRPSSTDSSVAGHATSSSFR